MGLDKSVYIGPYLKLDLQSTQTLSHWEIMEEFDGDIDIFAPTEFNNILIPNHRCEGCLHLDVDSSGENPLIDRDIAIKNFRCKFEKALEYLKTKVSYEIKYGIVHFWS